MVHVEDISVRSVSYVGRSDETRYASITKHKRGREIPLHVGREAEVAGVGVGQNTYGVTLNMEKREGGRTRQNDRRVYRNRKKEENGFVKLNTPTRVSFHVVRTDYYFIKALTVSQCNKM